MRFPRLYAAASLKLRIGVVRRFDFGPFSAALCRGLIEADLNQRDAALLFPRFPRLYAAASLKQRVPSASDRNGLRFPRLYAAASLKLKKKREMMRGNRRVFRGFMPRPH